MASTRKRTKIPPTPSRKRTVSPAQAPATSPYAKALGRRYPLQALRSRRHSGSPWPPKCQTHTVACCVANPVLGVLVSDVVETKEIHNGAHIIYINSGRRACVLRGRCRNSATQSMSSGARYLQPVARQNHVGVVALLRHDHRNPVVQFPAIAMQEHTVGCDRHLRVDATTGVSSYSCLAIGIKCTEIKP